LLTGRINGLADHFRTHKHDQAGRRGLIKMVGQRRRLLRYLHRKDVSSYQALVDRLGLRK
jgi:small subunit ribosomal protein S15